MRDSRIRFEADGVHLWIKIGGHCRAQLGPPAEDELRKWLIARAEHEMFHSDVPPAGHLELLASQLSSNSLA